MSVRTLQQVRMEDSETLGETVAKTRTGPRREIVNALHWFGGRANAKQIRDRGGLSTGQFGHHRDRLIEWNVIRQDGEEYIGRGGTAKVFELTETGRRVHDNFDETEPSTIEQRLADIEATQRDLAQKDDQIDERVSDLSDQITDLNDDVQRLGRLHNQIADHLERHGVDSKLTRDADSTEG